MKNFLIILLMIVLAATLILSGCAKPAPAPTPGPAPAPKPAPAPEKTWKLKFADPNPVNSDYIPAAKNWMANVEKATNGRVTFDYFPGGTLSKHKSLYFDCIDGVADLIWELPQFYPGKFPLMSVINLPFLGIKGIWDAGAIAMELMDKFPAMQKEFADVKILQFCGNTNQVFCTTKKKVTKLEDIKGLKIRVGGKNATEAMKLLGAVPMSPPWGEVVPMLEKGVLDGAQGNWGTISTFGHGSAIRYIYNIPLWVSEPCMTPAMNRKVWESMPPDIQNAIMSVSGIKGSIEYGYIAYENLELKAMEWLKDKKVTIEYTQPTDAEMEKWKKVGGQPVWDAWIAEMEGKGLPGKDVLAEAQKIVAKYNKNPTDYKHPWKIDLKPGESIKLPPQ